MATFEVPKSFDNIEEPTVIDEGVYKLVLSEPARIEPNRAGTGTNLVLDFRVTGEGPQADGVGLRAYFSMPSEADAGKTTRQNQPLVDWKLSMIREAVEALGGSVRGTKFDIPDAAMCKAKVVKEISEESGKPYNRIEGPLMPYRTSIRKS